MTPTNDAPVTVEDLTRPIIGIENRTAREAFDIMADRIRTRLAALASAPAGDGVEDEYTYDELWQAIADATRIEGGVIAISVRTFRESIRATDSAAALARPRAAVPPGSDAAYFGASDAACTLYPGTDQQAERAAFCEGAAHAVSRPRAAVGERE